MIRILVADDHPIVRKGLIQILSDAQGAVACVEAEDGNELLAHIDTGEFDVVLMDITMPGPAGLDVLKRIKSQRPGLPVLILSVHPPRHYAVRFLRAGASGYLNKASAPGELLQAIRRVKSGGRYVSPEIAESLLDELGEAPREPHETLSDREYQVMRLIAQGCTVSEIAALLSLSVKTISTYRARIMEKMRMRTNAELTHYAVRNRLTG